MNQAINNDIKNNANNLKNSIQSEINNIGQTSVEMGRNIRDTARDAALQAEQASRRAWTQAEGMANDARIKTQNRVNDLQDQARYKANEFQEQAITKGNEIRQQAIDTATDLKDQAEVAVGIQQESGFFSRINPMQYLKMPTLANITNKLSPKNLFCSSPTPPLSSNNTSIYQMGGNKSKQAIIELLQYNLVKREKILNILFEDLMKLAAKNKKIPKKNEKKVLKLLHEIDLIKKKNK